MPRQGLPTQPGFIHLSDDERKSGKWSRPNAQRAMELLHRDGLLAVTGLCDLAHLAAIREVMLAEGPEIRKAKLKVTDFNMGLMTNHLQSPPLSTPELLFEDVYSKQFVHQICTAYLGPDIVLRSMTANNAIANTTQRQAVHKDSPFFHPMCPFAISCQVLLSDFTPANGATEFWLGSHALTDATDQVFASQEATHPTCDVAPEQVKARALVRKGEQVSAPFGTFLLRDMRTWHSGMANPSDVDRIMLGMYYQAAWYPSPAGDLAFKFPEAARAILTKRTACSGQFIPNEEWNRVCQVWGGEGLDSKDRIWLPIVPGMKGASPPGPGETEWVTLNECAEEEKVIKQEVSGTVQ